MKQNPTSPKDEQEKVNDDHESFETAILFTIGLVIAFPVLLAKALIPSLAGRAGTWSYFNRHHRMCALLALVSVPLILADAYVGFHFLIHQSWRSALICMVLLWIVEVPLAGIYSHYLLRDLAANLGNGKSNPEDTSVISTAIHQAGFDVAARKFVRLGKVLPAFGERKIPVIGLNAKLHDMRFALLRYFKPDTSQLTNMIDGDYAVLPLNQKSPDHHLVIGATGAGKTHLLSRMASGALNSGWRVAVIDFKGSQAEADLYCSLPDVLTQKKSVVSYPVRPIDLWRGSKEDIAERIMGFLPARGTGDGQHYRDRTARAIKSVIVRTSAAPPTSVEELLNRIRHPLSFADDPEDRKALTAKDRGRPVADEIADTLGSDLDPLRGILRHGDNRGFSWPDKWDLAYIGFNGSEEGDLRLGSAIIHDFASWVSSADRMINPLPMMLIIDEASMLQKIAGAPSLVPLIQTARSRGISIIVASQTLTSLGDPGIELLHSGCVRWIGRTSNPEELILATGTKSVIESSHQESQGQYSGMKTHREQKAFKIDPDQIRMLPTFCWQVSSAGQVCSIYSPPIHFDQT